MPVIAPGDLEATGSVKGSVLEHPPRCIPRTLISACERMQVCHQGAYTGRRARALERNVHSVSIARVLTVCAITPLPVMAFVMLQELVPLDNPQAGWRANYRWFIRSTIIFMVLTLSYIQQSVVFLAPLKVSRKQALVITLSTSAAYCVVLMAISITWVFPIPFACVLTTGVFVFTVVFFGLFAAVIGRRTFTNTPRLSAHVRILKGVLGVETVMVLVYPAFSAVFQVLHGIEQLAFLGVLFLLKVAMRFIMAHALRRGHGVVRVEERWKARLPEVVVLSTELFHVLYLTACLQGQHVTVLETIGLSLFDSIGSMDSVRYLLRRPSVSLLANQTVQLGPTQHSLRAILPLEAASNSRSRSFMRLPTIHSASSFRTSSRRRSSTVSLSTSCRLSMALTESTSNFKLAERSSSGSSIISASRSPQAAECQSRQLVECQIVEPVKQPAQDVAVEISRLETLSMVEYFLLVEYVKCIIPVMYGIFQVVLAQLPNAVYYPSLASATPLDLSRSHANMAVFVALKIFFLTAFMVLLYRRLRFSVLHQLAFVLETAADDIQAKLAILLFLLLGA